MPEIKTKQNVEKSIKKLDKKAIMNERIKNNIVRIKEKTKESYEQNEISAEEYAESKVENKIQNSSYYGIRKANEIGKQNAKEIKSNIVKGKQQIKQVQNKLKDIKTKQNIRNEEEKATSQVYKKVRQPQKNIKTANRTVKTAGKKIKPTGERTKLAVIIKNKTGRIAVKNTQKKIPVGKIAKNTILKSTKKVINTSIAILKNIIVGSKAIISALIAGGWVFGIVIVLMMLLAMLFSSIFGIFFSSEKATGSKTMSYIISEINMEFNNKITEIQINNAHDDYEINSNRAEWKDILSIYTALLSDGKEQTDLITLDDNKIDKLKSIFWEMNEISYKIEKVEKDIEIINDDGSITVDKVTRNVLYIDITSKSLDEMMELYSFSDEQKMQVAELKNEKYNALWSNVIYGMSTGSTDIVEVAKSYIGNVGGETFWSWYGFSARVEWCACFVSFCANECGYIEKGIIPKFSSCELEGVNWFKTCGLWKDGGYNPKARRYNLF